MNKEQCQKWKKEDKKSMFVHIRISPKMSKWLKKENLSPTSIFNSAIQQLGFKE